MSEKMGESKSPFFVRGKRHDRDRVEVQIGYDSDFEENISHAEFEVSMMLMAPKNFGLKESHDPDIIRNEFQSYLRLSSSVSHAKFSRGLKRVQKSIDSFKANYNDESLKVLALELESLIKMRSSQFDKNKAQNKPNIKIELLEIQELLSSFRKVIEEKNLHKDTATSFSQESVEHDLLLLNEYLSHLYMSYLVKIHKHCSKDALPGQLDEIKNACLQESLIRKKFKLFLFDESNDQSKKETKYLWRMGLIKKYFQKSVFISSEEKDRESRLLVPIYGTSAAIAATWAILIQIYQMGSTDQRMSINTLAFVMVAIFAYVVKDIMKDYFRKFFFRSSQGYFPDYYKKLYIKNDHKRSCIGNVKEYFKIQDSSTLPDSIKTLRDADSSDYDIIDEDLLHYKKRFTLNIKKLHNALNKKRSWGFREVIRIKLERYLSNLADESQKVSMLTEDGTPVERKTNRIYYCYLGVLLTTNSQRKNEIDFKKFKLFKISMNKAGILKCKSLKTAIIP